MSQITEQHLTVYTADAMELKLPIAGVGGRSYAFLIDWHIRFIFVFLWMLGIPMLFGQLSTIGDFFRDLINGSTISLFIFFVPPIIVYVFYHPILEILMKGRTPGKKIAGVRIITNNGHTPGIGAILIRNIFRLIDSMPGIYLIGLITAMLTEKAVRVGDIAAGTLLVYEEKEDKKLLANVNGLKQDKLSPQQWELVHELLDRWNDLEIDYRIQLADKLVHAIGMQSASLSSANKKQKDSYYFAALKQSVQQ